MRKLSPTHLVILLCLSVFAFSTHSIASQKDGLLKIYFFDIGQGDSIFVETPNGNQVLIDGGPDNAVSQKLGEIMPFYDRSIDMVVLSHPHADHVGGLIEVLRRYDVGAVIEAKEIYDSPIFYEWQKAVDMEDAVKIEAIKGLSINLGNDVTIDILYPFNSLEGESVSNPNNSSVVLMLRYKENEILLVGDIEIPVERRLLLKDISLNADILKVGHHGSKTSSMAEFLYSVSPEVAIMQVGEGNRYGHPSPEVLERFDNFGIRYYRNDLDGDIKVISDGENFQIITN